MKKLLILLSLCISVLACDNMQKPAMDVVSDMMTSTEEPFAGVPRITVSDAFMQDKITGPWLWMIAPTEPDKGGAESIDIDSLAVASDGAVTEMDVATNGVAEGDRVGDLVWTLGTIAGPDPTVRFSDNINDVVNEIGLGQGNIEDHSSYALISLVSATDQSDVTMRVGSDDAIKVWLNGEVVHNNPVNRGANGFLDTFAIDLKAGDNLLLVKVSERSVLWAMFVGIEDPSTSTEESVTDVAPPEETVEGTLPVDETSPASEIPEITFDNALDLMPGLYRLRPTAVWRTGVEPNLFIFNVEWGNVRDFNGQLIERDDFPADAPKIAVSILINPQPFYTTLDGEEVIGRDPDTRIHDEIVVEIVSKHSEEEKKGGDRVNRFTYQYVRYSGKIIENLTNPDRLFEYDE